MKAFTREEIPVNHQQIPRREHIKEIPHLKEIAEKLPDYMIDIKVGILIGNNCPKALQPLKVIPTHNDGPYAIKLHHGWTINGPLQFKFDNNSVSCNRIMFQEVNDVKELPLPAKLVQMFERDFSESDLGKTPGQKGQSREDEKFSSIVNNSRRDEDGHFVIPLPFRNEHVDIPNNRQCAVSRAQWQKKKMQADSRYHEEYVAFMDKILSKGYAVKVPENEVKSGQWYLPHHAVYHKKKPGKIRIVFDCSARYRGVSLNDQLLQGPDLSNSIVGVLTRFREEPVCFMGDIESMFYQVRVPMEQQNYLRFLWWPDGNLEAELQEYQMTVHIFGAVSSPSVCNYALKQTADLTEQMFDPTAANTIRSNFYVDDCLKSAADEETTKQLLEDVRNACAYGGFNLTKFTSSSISVLENISPDDYSKEARIRSLDYDQHPVERTLGIQWSVENDVFQFSTMIPSKPPTRRGILSVVSSIYDPLGFLAPYVLCGKRILQELCTEKNLGWDDEISVVHKAQWEKWLLELPKLKDVSVPRCVKPENFGSVTSREVHVFSDASSIGYGSVAYLSLTNDKGVKHTAFLMGKARLAPIRKVSVPRLELTAATVALKLGNSASLELETKPDKMTFHTDSTTVLHYINSETKRFPVFVSNRVQLIHDYSTVDQWRYVDTKSNPADIASRGLKSPSHIQTTVWLDGPEFLKLEEKDWPPQPVTFDGPATNEAQVKCGMTEASDQNPVDRLLSSYSDWYKLKKAVAVILKFKKVLLKRCQKTHDDLKLTVQDLDEAEIALVKYVQKRNFQSEIEMLSAKENEAEHERRNTRESLPRSSPIHNLDPFVDEDGLLRVGGRLSRASMEYDAKHQLLLPHKSDISELIVRHIHDKLSHAGRNHVLSTLREKFWIVKANTLVRHVIRKCVKCRLLRMPTAEQKMSDLPKERMASNPPFTHTGVDIFGPFYIKEGRKELKRYGALFTCMASRAIHLETVNTMDTDSFLCALRRFVARRGNVQVIFGDNGTNFVGARRELWQALKEMNHDTITEKMLKENIDWRFNPPTASHMGGVWERQIRSVRKVLSPILKDFAGRLDDESFRTLMCEVEAIVNSRPLTSTSDDPDDFNPLSPANLLTMKAMPMPPPGQFQRENVYMRKRWKRVQFLADQFWRRRRKEYLQTLQTRQKWNTPRRNMQTGDVVLIRDDNTPRSEWRLGRITKTEQDKKGMVRSVELRTQASELRRPVNKLVLILPVEEQTN